MRKVVAYQLVSLDGVAEQPETFFGWDDELDVHLGRVIAEQDTVLLGRRSWDEWSRYWPTSDIEPFATFINNVQKYVVTSSPLVGEWGRSEVVDGDLAEFVTSLKSAPGRDIGVHASISLTQSLLAAGLIDELRLVVAPAVQVRGRRLLDNVAQTRLTLSRCAASPTGHLMLDYEVG